MHEFTAVHFIQCGESKESEKLKACVSFSIFLFPETAKSQERELRTVSTTLSKTSEEASSLKKSHNKLEREKTRVELSLKSLQDKYDQLTHTHEEALEKIKEARRQSSSSRENEDFAEVLKKLAGESKAREEAVSRAEAAEQQCSMLKLDVKTSKEEISQLKQELATTQSKVCQPFHA